MNLHNDIKRFDNKINYLEDIFYHILALVVFFVERVILFLQKSVETKLSNNEIIVK